MSRVLVESLSAEVSQRDVEEEFRVYGAIRSVKLPALPGYACVEFNDRRDALNAVAGTLAGNSSRDVYLLDDSNIGSRRRGGCLNGRRVDLRCIRGRDEEPTKESVDVELVESVAEIVLSIVKMFNSMDKILKDLDVGPTEFEKSVAQVVRRTVKRFDSKDLYVGGTEFEEYVAKVFPKSLEMYMSRKKVLKDFAPIELEESVAQALFDLEHTNGDLQGDLKDLYIDSATQVNVSANCKAILIRYPYKLHEGFRKIHGKLVTQLEKKFLGNVVILVGRGRPPFGCPPLFLSDHLLSDIVYPAVIAGFRPCLDHSSVLNCLLYSNARNDTKDKLDAFAAVFRKLCWMNVEFDYA